MIFITVLLVLAILFGLVLLIGGLGIGSYHRLVALHNDYKNPYAPKVSLT